MSTQPRIRRTMPVQGVACPPMPRPPQDFHVCHDTLGAMCGHGAFAAALGISVSRACLLFPELSPDRGWINLPEMERSLRQSKERGLVDTYHSSFTQWPEAQGAFQTGLVIVQWLGSWLDAGVPPGAACRHTHWIATCGGNVEGGLVYDVNLGEWVSRARWERALAEELRRALSPKSTGWRVKRGYEIAANPPIS